MRSFFLLFCSQKYILGFLARVVFYRTEQVKAENEQTPHIRTQTDPKDLRTSRGSEASETAVRVTVNKWRKREIMEEIGRAHV